MPVISAAAFIIMATVAFGFAAMVLTFPSWLVGRFSAGKHRHPPANFATVSRGRRLGAWGAFSVISFAGLSELGKGHLAVSLAMILVGVLGAQYFAYVIGFVDGDRRYAHRHARDYIPIGPMDPIDYPLSSGTPYGVVNPTQALPVQEEEQQETGTAYPTDEYPMARPVDDDLTR